MGGFVEEGCDGGGMMSTAGEAAVKGPGVFSNLLGCRTQAVDAEDVSEDEALEWTPWV